MNIVQRRLKHVNPDATSINLHGIDTAEITAAVNSWRAPMMPAGTGLRL